MTRTDFSRTVAAIVCTLVTSATCVLGAIAPAQTGTDRPVAAARQIA